MESFEHITKIFLESRGYAVTSNVKFPVRVRTKKKSRKEYQTHGYEVDLVAVRCDSLLLGSVKSYFGSRGLSRQSFPKIADSSKAIDSHGCRIFHDKEVRDGIIKGASDKYGFPKSSVRLALLVGKFAKGHEQDIRKYLEKVMIGGAPVQVFGIDEIMSGVIEASKSKTYIDDPVIATIKSLEELGWIHQGEDGK